VADIEQPYTPSPEEAQFAYEAGRTHITRLATGVQATDVSPFTAEWLRMIEAVRREEREKAERWKATADSADALLRAVMAELDIRPDEDPVLAVRGIIAGIRNDEREKAAKIAEDMGTGLGRLHTPNEVAATIRAQGKEQDRG
jgi:hypothetical protein